MLYHRDQVVQALLSVCMHAELGTRPGLSGQTLVSTGLADFDKLIGGGVPLGTVTLLLEDTYTQHHVTLLKYFLAEGAANNQALHWSAGHSRNASAVRALPQQVQHTPKVMPLSCCMHADADCFDVSYKPTMHYIRQRQVCRMNSSMAQPGRQGRQTRDRGSAAAYSMAVQTIYQIQAEGCSCHQQQYQQQVFVPTPHMS